MFIMNLALTDISIISPKLSNLDHKNIAYIND